MTVWSYAQHDLSDEQISAGIYNPVLSTEEQDTGIFYYEVIIS